MTAADFPWYLWVLLFSLLFTQGIWVFLDAQKHGYNKWLWGFFALLNVPSNGLVYWLVTRKLGKRRPKP